jgi:hypothetical protein
MHFIDFEAQTVYESHMFLDEESTANDIDTLGWWHGDLFFPWPQSHAWSFIYFIFTVAEGDLTKNKREHILFSVSEELYSNNLPPPRQVIDRILCACVSGLAYNQFLSVPLNVIR